MYMCIGGGRKLSRILRGIREREREKNDLKSRDDSSEVPCAEREIFKEDTHISCRGACFTENKDFARWISSIMPVFNFSRHAYNIIILNL